MANENPRENSIETVELPAPTAWPMITALGLTLLFAGLVTNAVVSAVGLVMFIAGLVGWFGEVLPVEHRESVRAEPEAAIAPVRTTVAHLEVGEAGHRARLPIEIYPYSAGIKGGIAGGFVMAALAVLHGLALHHSPWYTINILAATALPGLATASTAALSQFNLEWFAVALGIHAIASLLVGLLYGVLLPMLPGYPIFFGGIVTPPLWTGLLYATLDVINPVLDARIEWRWFLISQIGFGLAAGLVVARSEKITTIQHLPFAMRTGIRTAGFGDRGAE